jgi:hypothetical protein
VAATRYAERLRTELRKALGVRLLYGAERDEYAALLKCAKEEVAQQDASAAASMHGVASGSASTGEAARTDGVSAAGPADKNTMGQPQVASNAALKQRAAMDLLIGRTYGAQHLLRLLVAVPTLRHAPAVATGAPALSAAVQTAAGAATAAGVTQAADGGGAPAQQQQQQQQQQRKASSEVEHFIQFLAGHAAQWLLGDPSSYAAAAATVAQTAAAAGERQSDTTASRPAPDAQVGSGTAGAVKAGVRSSAAAAAPSKVPSKGASDWRERALSFLGSGGSGGGNDGVGGGGGVRQQGEALS